MDKKTDDNPDPEPNARALEIPQPERDRVISVTRFLKPNPATGEFVNIIRVKTLNGEVLLDDVYITDDTLMTINAMVERLKQQTVEVKVVRDRDVSYENSHAQDTLDIMDD